MRSRWWIWLLVQWVLAAPALADTTLPFSQEPLPQAQTAPRRGLLYEIRGAENVVYLFGTIHVGKQEFYPLDIQVTRALTTSKRLYLELNTNDSDLEQAVTQWGLYPDGVTLKERLPPALLERVRSRLAIYAIAPERALRMKPWLMSQTLGLADVTRSGYNPGLGVDLYLTAMAKAQHKTIAALETPREQFSILGGMGEIEQIASLKRTLDQLDTGRATSQVTALVGAWAAADRAGLERAVAAASTGENAGDAALISQLLGSRNEVMAERIDDIVRFGPGSFVAVGVLHLVGPGNVVELLRGRGLRVTEL